MNVSSTERQDQRSKWLRLRFAQCGNWTPKHAIRIYIDAFAKLQDVKRMEFRKDCSAEANKRWPSSNQDMQTNRDYAYRTCAVQHGVRNP